MLSDEEIEKRMKEENVDLPNTYRVIVNLMLLNIPNKDDRATAEEFAYVFLQIYRRSLPLLNNIQEK